MLISVTNPNSHKKKEKKIRFKQLQSTSKHVKKQKLLCYKSFKDSNTLYLTIKLIDFYSFVGEIPHLRKKMTFLTFAVDFF